MNALLVLAAGLCIQGQQPQQQPRANEQDRVGRPSASVVDGSWKVVYCEENGRPKGSDKDVSVTVAGNTVTIKNGDGRAQSMRLELGPNHTVRVVPEGSARPNTPTSRPDAGQTAPENTRATVVATRGIYIPSQEFLCIALEDDVTGSGVESRPASSATDPARPNNPTGNATPQQPTPAKKAAMVIILRKDGARDRSGQ
jgi:hypothetical protein